MDVDNLSSLRGLLPSILASISSSRFVAIDLELSGIPRKSFKSPKDQQGPGSKGRQSLQQRYSETKQAAERFHILQFGLTCVQEDVETGKYILKPYNFYLSPLIDKRLKIERDFTFQNGAVDFLLSHQFRLETALLRGVPHLSWELEAEARAIAAAEWDKDSYIDIGIDPGDLQSFDLMKRVRQEIEAWRAENPQSDFLNIMATEPGSTDAQSKGLNRYQKRLIHQLVRAEYPDMTTTSRDDFVQLIPKDKDREAAHRARKELGFGKTLSSQIGLRWIIEAISSNIDDVVPPQYHSEISSTQFFQDTIMSQDIRCAADSDKHRTQLNDLLGKKPMLVGHNLFIDLIYLFACFFGALPDRVEDFQKAIAKLFPLIFDTKYLADTIQENSPHYNSSLEGIDAEFSVGPGPTIEMPAEFERYQTDARLHEAGYDSFLTARALVRISAKLNDQSGTTTIKDEDFHTGPVNTDTSINHDALDHNNSSRTVGSPIRYAESHDHNRFSHLSIEEPGTPLSNPGSARRWMPPASSTFWQFYGQKLRVNGTVEGLCDLSSSEPLSNR